MPEKEEMTITQTIDYYLEIKGAARSSSQRTYRVALRKFKSALDSHGLDPSTSLPHQLSAEVVNWLLDVTGNLAPSTERLYAGVLSDFLKFLAAEDITTQVNLAKVAQLIRWRSRRPGRRLPTFPEKDIERLIEYADELKDEHRWVADKDIEGKLIDLRDRALIITLADTGLRISEACNLKRGDIVRGKKQVQAIVIGKGDKQAVVRFSERAIGAIDDYLKERAVIDGRTGKPLANLHVFSRHDRGAGAKKIKGMTTTTGRNIIDQRVKECLGKEAVGTISPHFLRHFFVTKVLRKSGDIYTAKRMARHENIAITERYAHLTDAELDNSYRDIFDE